MIPTSYDSFSLANLRRAEWDPDGIRASRRERRRPSAPLIRPAYEAVLRAAFLGATAATILIAAACRGGEEAPLTAGRTGAPRLVEDLRIGVSAGADEYMFGNIGAIAEHPDGTIFIADTQVPIIRRYDAEGVFLHDVGGEGQGPGEYQRLQGLKITPDGNLAFWDPSARRITEVRPDGAWVRDFTGDSGLHTSSRPTFQVDHEGHFYVLTTLQSGGTIVRPGEGVIDTGIERIMGFHEYAPEGEHLGSIEIPSEEPDTPGFVLSTNEGMLRNFVTETISRMGPFGHLIVGHNGSYSFEVRDGDEVLLTVEHEWDPVPLTPDEHEQWSAWVEYIQASAAERGMAADDYAPIPASKPAFSDLRQAPDGTIWVRRYAEAHQREREPRPEGDARPLLTWWQYPTWDVFDAEGELRGTIVLPHDTYISVFGADHVWTVQMNEDEEDVAVRYRIEGLGG